jgi:hypothetical protein
MLQPQEEDALRLEKRLIAGSIDALRPGFLSQEATSAPPSLRYGATNEYADAP